MGAEVWGSRVEGNVGLEREATMWADNLAPSYSHNKKGSLAPEQTLFLQ